jgi:hypothetical protein
LAAAFPKSEIRTSGSIIIGLIITLALAPDPPVARIGRLPQHHQ